MQHTLRQGGGARACCSSVQRAARAGAHRLLPPPPPRLPARRPTSLFKRQEHACVRRLGVGATMGCEQCPLCQRWHAWRNDWHRASGDGARSHTRLRHHCLATHAASSMHRPLMTLVLPVLLGYRMVPLKPGGGDGRAGGRRLLLRGPKQHAVLAPPGAQLHRRGRHPAKLPQLPLLHDEPGPQRHG